MNCCLLRHSINSPVISIKFVYKESFSFFSVCTIIFLKFLYNCYFEICKIMTRFVEVDSCCFCWEYAVDISFVIRESISNCSLRFSNISLFAIFFVTFNHINNILCLTICRCCNLPIKFISFNLLPLQDEGASLAGFVAFLHSFQCSLSFFCFCLGLWLSPGTLLCSFAFCML